MDEITSTRVAAGSVFYNTSDILPSAIWNLVAQGITDFYFIHHDVESEGCCSSFDQFAGIASITVTHKSTAPFLQGRMFTLIMSAARQAGYEVFLPFDSDEFWQPKAGAAPLLEQILEFADSDDLALAVEYVQLVQKNSVRDFEEANLGDALYRVVPKHLSFIPDPRISNHLGLSLNYGEKKVLVNLKNLPEGNSFYLAEGSHHILVGDSIVDARRSEDLEIGHLGQRSENALSKRYFHKQRRLAGGFSGLTGFHISHFTEGPGGDFKDKWDQTSWVEGDAGIQLVTAHPDIELAETDVAVRALARIQKVRREPAKVSREPLMTANQFKQMLFDFAVDLPYGFPSTNSLIWQIRAVSAERDALADVVYRKLPEHRELVEKSVDRRLGLIGLIERILKRIGIL